MHNCLWCDDPIPEGRGGQFCSTEHEWFYRRSGGDSRKHEEVNGHDATDQPDTRSTFAHGYSPRRR